MTDDKTRRVMGNRSELRGSANFITLFTSCFTFSLNLFPVRKRGKSLLLISFFFSTISRGSVICQASHLSFVSKNTRQSICKTIISDKVIFKDEKNTSAQQVLSTGPHVCEDVPPEHSQCTGCLAVFRQEKIHLQEARRLFVHSIFVQLDLRYPDTRHFILGIQGKCARLPANVSFLHVHDRDHQQIRHSDIRSGSNQALLELYRRRLEECP